MLLYSHNGNIHINKHFHLQPPSFLLHLHIISCTLITQQGNFQVCNEHHYLNGKNTSKFPAVCSHFLSLSPTFRLNNLPWWRRLCNKKASYAYFFSLLSFLLFSPIAWWCCEARRERKLKRKSLKGKSSTFLPSEKISTRHFPLPPLYSSSLSRNTQAKWKQKAYTANAPIRWWLCWWRRNRIHTAVALGIVIYMLDVFRACVYLWC